MSKHQLKEINHKKRIAEIIMIIGGTFFIIGMLSMFRGVGAPHPGMPVQSLFQVPLTLFFTGFTLTGLGSFLFFKVKQDFRHTFIKNYFDELDHITYTPKQGIKTVQGLSKETVLSSNFMEKTQFFKSFDLLEGHIDGIRFTSSDVWLQNRQSSGKSSTMVTIFLGRVFVFDFHKPLNGDVLVLEKYRPKNEARRFERVKLESIAFERTFNTYAKIPKTAFYILTPHFMERLMELEKNHPGNIGLSFQDGKLTLAIHTNRRTFALRFLRPVDQAFLETIKQDIHIIEDLVHSLKLSDTVYV